MGIVVLPTVVAFSKVLARLAIGLDKRPELVAHLTQRRASADNEAAERITLVESSANVIREAFKKCLSERSGNTATGLDASGKPGGRRIGIYPCANICLKLFFHCKKLRSAEQIFGNIYQQSPPLSCFPASQRVTFLYYLGRYHFANNHFFRAQLALQAAYHQCHRQCLKQRRSILIYWIASNVILGRFPASGLLQRPEAEGLGQRFLPICQAIRRGDMAEFASLTSLRDANARWLLRRRILFPLRDRCEVLVWRSLTRRTFLLSGTKGEGARAAPTVDIRDVLSLVLYFERRIRAANARGGGMAVGDEDDLGYGEVDPDLEGEVDQEYDVPSIEDVEAAVASLVRQGLLHGYVSHKHCRFAIVGAKTKPPLEAGFPVVWDVIQNAADREVPGWVTDQGPSAGAQRAGGGMVVNLTGVRPVGTVPG
jgi:nuclear mRNA export protein PCID2/THP1